MFGGASYLYSSEIEADWVDVERVSLTLPRLAPDFDGYRIVQVSDIHMDDGMSTGQVEEFVRQANAEEPDTVVFTGDLVTYEPERFAPKLVEALSDVSARDGALGVLGNHDHKTDPDLMREVLRESGLVDLYNDVWSVERGGEALHFGGIDDVWLGQPRLERVISRLPQTGAAISLVHEPDYADVTSATGRFDLQLSGHSHGGQVRLPLVGAPFLPRYAEKYPIGRYGVGGMIQYTNRGLGTLGPDVRFNCRPEITTLTLRSPRT